MPIFVVLKGYKRNKIGYFHLLPIIDDMNKHAVYPSFFWVFHSGRVTTEQVPSLPVQSLISYHPWCCIQLRSTELLDRFIYLFLLTSAVSFIRVESQLSLLQEINIDLRCTHGCMRRVRIKSPKYFSWKTPCNRENYIHSNSSRPFLPKVLPL